MSNILVTGGAGFIGSHLVDELIRLGHRVIIIDDLSTGKEEFINKKVKFIEKDINNENPSYWARRMDDYKIEYIFHLAATPRIQLSLDQPYDTFEANTLATANILEAGRLAWVKKIIYASSSSVYGKSENLPLDETMICNPQSPYAIQKYLSELLCKNYAENFNMDIIALRYFNVYGKRMSMTGAYKLVMAIFNEQKKAGVPLTIYGDGQQTRDFTYIDDIVNASISTMISDIKGFDVFNVCSGKEIKIIDVAKLFNHTCKFIPNPREKWEEIRKYGSFSKINKLLNYYPKIFINEGIQRYLGGENK